MIEFLNYWLRGLVYTVLMIVVIALLVGLISMAINFPQVTFPVLVLIILPLLLGGVGGK